MPNVCAIPCHKCTRGFDWWRSSDAALVFIGIKLNLKNLRTLYAHIHQDRSFYRIWSVFGGVLGAAYVTAIPVIGSYGIKDPWFGLIMIAIGLGLFVPLISVLKRHIQRGS